MRRPDDAVHGGMISGDILRLLPFLVSPNSSSHFYSCIPVILYLPTYLGPFSFSLALEETATMSPSRLGVFASLALAAGAVLIPSTMVSDEGGNGNTLPLLAMDRSRRPLVLECPGCAFASQNDQTISWEEGVGSSYVGAFR